MSRPPATFTAALAAEGIQVSPGQMALLGRFLELLLEANRSFNLTSVHDPAEAWHRHVLESLALARLLRPAMRVADLGSGGGLPGLPLAVALSDARFVLIEATGKKARFLGDAAAELGLGNVEVLNIRAEDAGREAGRRGDFDAVVARGVGSLAELVELALPLLREGGQLLAVKGARADQEVEAAGRALELVGGELRGADPLLPAVGGDSVVVRVEKTGPTPEKYPRRPGAPRKRPL
jgi:16S rRNA (guanine527-N7)-methyltransferase